MSDKSRDHAWRQAAADLLQRQGGKVVVEIVDNAASAAEGGRQGDHPGDLPWRERATRVYCVAPDGHGLRSAAADGVRPEGVTLVGEDPVEFLRSLDQDIDLLYLRASPAGRPASKARHLELYRAARGRLHAKSAVLIADTHVDHGGLGGLVVPEAVADGYEVLLWGRLTLLARVRPAEVRDVVPRVGPPVPSDASFEDAIRLHREGFGWEAEQIYRHILRRWPAHSGALHLLGVVRHQVGDHDGALESIGKAIRLAPNQAVFFSNYGAALLAKDRPVEALACFHRALQIRPEFADGLSNLGMAQEQLGQDEAAMASYRRVLEIQPDHRDALSKLSRLLEQRGQEAEAIRLHQQAAADRPSAEAYVNLANMLLGMGQNAEAVSNYQKALGIDPDYAVAHYNLGSALQEQHRTDEARQHLNRAAELVPHRPFLCLRAKVFGPTIFRSTAQLEAYRQQVAEALDAAKTAPIRTTWDDLLNGGVFPSFNFSYHGRNNRSIKEKFAALYEPVFRGQPQPEGSGLSDRRRIGVLVTQRHEGIFLRCMKGILEQLDRERFELVILCSAKIVENIRRAIRRDDLTFVPFSRFLGDAIRRVREAQCDLVYYWEVGSDAQNYFLPFARLAPVQCTSHGSQITSGVPAVDHFYSSDLMEVPGAQDHYTERLWRSRTLLMCQSRLPQVPPAARSYFGLPDGRHLYMCLQNPLKIHPDMDPLVGAILDQDPKGAVVFLSGRHPHAAQLLRERFAETIPNVGNRAIFLPYQRFEDYCRLLQLADVVLDPPHFGAGSSSYDIFSFDLPAVTLPGELIVGRVAYAFYRKMGVSDLVASSPEHYVQLAVRVASDREYRLALRDRLAVASHVLFDDLEAVRDHERFFEEVIVSAQESRTAR
jgi:protein O-GlcNAc transferase